VAKYGGFLYYPDGDALAKLYGGDALPSLSVEPFTASVVDYDQVNLSWTNPVGEFRRFRLLRNQEGIPDTEEDGLILYDGTEAPSFNNFLDNGNTQSGDVVPIIRGRHVYYSIWLWLGEDEDNRWYLVGNVYTTMPTSHPVITGTGTESTTHTRLMESLPKVLTSRDLNALGTTDYSSDLAKFLEGFSFTTDQLLTLTDLLLPNSSFINLTPELLNAYAGNLGLERENRLSTKYQRKLVRNALTLYSEKGTADSLNGFVESLTGYSTDLILSPNLMLSAQDSTFYRGVGNWVADSKCTLSSITTEVPPGTGQATVFELIHRVDTNYTGRVVSTQTNAVITNGAANVRTKGIPVEGGASYTFSFYQKTAVSSPTLTLGVSWYDYFGNIIGTQVTGTGTGTSAWTKLSLLDILSPPNAVYAIVSIKFSAVGTYFVDMIQFSDSSALETYEARGVGVVLSPTKENLILNPSVEDTTDEWVGVNTTLTRELLGTPISGVPTGLRYLESTSSAAAAVSISTTSPAAAVIPGNYTFSSYVRCADAPSAGYNVTLEAYTSTPYSNYVLVPTPTGASTGWSYSAGTGGTFSTTYPSTGGPTNGTNVRLAFTATPASGDVSVAISSAGITPTLVEDTEYAFKMWVKTSRASVLFPVITWTGADEETGDDVSIAANTWTQVQFTTNAPGEATDAGVSLVFAVSDNAFVSGDIIQIAGADFGPVTYTSTTNWVAEDSVWERFSATVSVPSDAVIPDSLSFKTTIAYVSTGEEVDLDGAQLEFGDHASDYFDGDSHNANWEGGVTFAGAAYSHMYGSRDAKIARLRQELVNYLPMGTPYYVETTEGVEFGGAFKGYA
jgi:hypothetical protein